MRRWDRQRWISVFSSHSPTIREVTECLGLGLSASSSTTNRGIPKFDNPDYRKISSEVTKLSKELPKERCVARFCCRPAQPRYRAGGVARYLRTRYLGQGCRSQLSPHPRSLQEDVQQGFVLRICRPQRNVSVPPNDLPSFPVLISSSLKIHLHRWIIIKACYYIRNMKLKRPSNANDYDTLADIEGDGGVRANFIPGSPDLIVHQTTC